MADPRDKEHIMKTFSRKNTLAAVILAAASVGLPTMAQAGNYSTTSHRYEECKKSDTESQIIGGVLGAVLGGVAGSEIAGRGDRNEGTAIGAAAGAAAGIAIANARISAAQEEAHMESHLMNLCLPISWTIDPNLRISEARQISSSPTQVAPRPPIYFATRIWPH